MGIRFAGIVLKEEKEDDRIGKDWGNLLGCIDKKTSRREGKQPIKSVIT